MPTVPRREPASVGGLKPLPDVQYSPSSATAETFGGGASLEKVAAEAKGLGDVGMKLAITQQEAADKSIAQQYDVLAVKKKNQLMNDVAMKFRGQKSLEASNYVNTEWQKFSDEQKNTMPNDRVKQLYDKRSVLYYSQMDNYVQDRTAAEITALQEANSKAEREVTIQDSALNWPNKQIQDMNYVKLRGNVEQWAETHGIPVKSPEFEKVWREEVTNLHKAKIDRMLAEGADEHAKKYFQEHKAEFNNQKEAIAYGDHIDQQSKQLKTDILNAKKAEYDLMNRDLLLRSFDGDLVLSEVQRLYKEDKISESDYNAWENKLTNKEYEGYRNRLGIGVENAEALRKSTSSVFNNIRQKQLTGSAGKGEIERMIRDASGKELLIDDARWLSKQNDKIAPSPDDILIDTQGNRIRAFGEKYFKTSFAGVPYFGKKSQEAKQAEIEGLTKEFNKRVVNEKATGDKIVEIANKMIEDKVKRDDPSLAGYESLPDITVDIDNKVKTIFPGPTANKKKFKLRGVLTRESAETTRPPEKKKE